MFEHLSISENCWQLVVRDENVDRTVVPFKKKSDPLKKSKLQPKIVLDQETERVFALLMDNGGSTYDEEAEQDPEKKAYWERERHILEQRVDTFLDMMSQFQGTIYSLSKLNLEKLSTIISHKQFHISLIPIKFSDLKLL